ncbi:MAG TPA: RHS repeat-associated core domain-containing protein [Thermoanaerobaculia bacterium]|nr:RHS repeat-associated core domain-containing protein [Thermoanaerobaculia bacterium]
MNWPYGPPSDAVSPLPPPPDTSITVTQCEECQGHSIVETENQRLREEIPVQGTPYSLTYNSGRANRQRYQVTVHVSGAAVLPASLKAMDVSFSIAGRSFTQSLLPEQNKDLTFTWDGVDVYNRPVQGVRPADISVGYRYAAAYRPPQTSIQAFAASGVGTSAITDRTRNEVTFAQGWSVPLGQWSNNTTGFGGWSFSAQRVYDTIGRTLYDPEATERGSDLALNGESAIYRVAGTGFPGVPDTSLLATQSGTEGALSVQPTPDGGFYFADDSPGSLDPSCQCLKFVDQAIFKVDAAGHVAVVAGIPGCSNNCPAGADGAPAATSWVSPSHVTTSLDGTVYFSEITFSGSNRADRIRRIVNGRLQTVAGAPTILVGDNGPATQAGLGTVNGIAIGNDGVLYIATVSAGIRRVGVDGIITTIAGMGISRADNIPATQSKFVSPMGVAVGPDGSVYFSCTQAGPNFTPAIGRISPDGFLHFVAGGGPFLPAGQDGSVATAVSIQSPGGLGVTAEGDPVWGDTSNSRAFVWTVKAGILHVITTSPTARQVFTGNAPADGALARSVFMFRIPETKVGPDGSVYLIDGGHWTILKTAPLFPAMKSGSASTIIPANDGIVGYIFENGRHVRTVNTITGTTLETLSYDANGLLKSVTDVDGQSTIDRDSAGNPTVITAPGGQQTQLSVGAQGLESVSSAAGNYAFSYNSLGLLSQLTDPRTGLHKFTYDESGLLTKDEDPAGGFLSLTRTGTTGNFTVVRGSAEGRTESLAWHQSSDVLTTRPVTGSDGLVTTRNENGDGSKNETSPEGVTTATTVGPDTRFGMSAPVMLTESDTMPSGTKLNLTSSRQVFLSHDSDPLSLLTYSSTLGINGRVFTSAFTKSNRTVVTTTPAGRQITTVLNDKDRPASVQVAGLASVAYGYDPRGMISSVTVGSRNTTFGYDARQRLKSIRDPLGRTVSYDYDDADRVTTETLPDGRQIQFSHDAAGNVTSISPPARPAHTFGFTPVNLLESYTAPTVANVTSTVTTYTYNRDRQLTLAARPDGTTVDWGYDSAGRLATITEPRGQHAFTYEATKGTLTGISAPDGNALQFTYDGGLLRSLSSTGAVASTIAFNYDNNLRVTSESVNGANSIAFGYDNDDLLTSAGVLTLRRDASNGLLTGTTLSNVVDTYGYNTFGEVTSYTLQLGGSTIFTLGYTRDDAGRIAAKTETANGQTATTSYGYDPAGRLTDVTSAGTTTHYDYDDNGNRTGVTTDSGQIVATYDAQDRLTTYNGASYFYSANGDLQKKIDAQGTTLYSYDALGNLRSVTLPDGKLIEYVIDASNRRVGKKVNGSLVVGWIYSGPLRIVAETDGTGAVSKRFIYGSRPNVPDYMVWQGSAYRIVTDHLGSPRYVLEVSGGSLADAVTYDAFGAVVSDTNRGFVPFGFAGGLYDPDTGLTRYGLRDYDAATGRWTSKDPLLFWGTGRSDYDWTTNTYQYCDGDPVNFSDPTGLQMDSVSRSLQEAIARGDADEIAEILEDAGEELPDKLRAAARKAVQRFRSKAKDIISKECKGSINREFPEEFRDKTLQDIWKEARGGDKAAQTAKKLLSDARFRK